MNEHDTTGGETHNDFWGGTPDWTDSPQRPRRATRSGDVTGAIRGLWSSAMGAGASATREHRVFDATAAAPADFVAEPGMFDDLDDHHGEFRSDEFRSDEFRKDEFRDGGRGDDVPFDRTDPIARSHDILYFPDQSTGPDQSTHSDHFTGAVPVVDVFDEDTLASVAPVSMSERAPSRRRGGGLDPLLVRVGAVAIATTLLVPLVMGLSSDGENNDTISSATTAVDATPIDTTLATDPVATAATTTPAGLDPSSLPPAVPVATEGSDASTGESRNEGGETSTDGSTPADTDAESVAESDASESDTSWEAASAAMETGASDSATDSSGAAGVDAAATADDGAERVSTCSVTYTVVAGDYWLRLADAADVQLAELLEINGASTSTPLYPDSEICLPAGATTPAPPTTVSQTQNAAPPATTPATTAPATTTPPTTTPPTTAPRPTTPPTTATPPTNSNTDASPAEVEQIIRDVFPDELEEKALQIAYRESRFVPTAKNYCCYGLFQMYWEVHKSWLAGIGITDDQQLFDPATNARAAYALYQRSGGWGPWSQTNY